MPRNAVGALIAAVICLIIAWLLAPLIPEATVAHIIGVIAWIGCVVCAALGIFYLVSGRNSV